MRERWTGWAFSILLTLSPISMTIFTLWTEIPLVESFLKTVNGSGVRIVIYLVDNRSPFSATGQLRLQAAVGVIRLFLLTYRVMNCIATSRPANP